ncbi:MAG: penicillin-binding protein 2 [Coriobacteriales bacterium]|jgi:penicillin-binding protein 2|nr:penicillin-binding protein 2 [Coriobacteriales bacterium]
MNATVLTIIIAAAVFLLVLSSLIVFFTFRARKRKELVVKKSFERHGAPTGVGIDDVRKPDVSERKERKEGKGRLYAFGVVIMGIFGTLAMRLWSLQMISGGSYQRMAEENMTSEASIPAPRGRILDRNGKELVGNRPSLCVTAAKRVVEEPVLVNLLSLILGMPRGVVRRNLLDDTLGAQANRVIATDVPMKTVAFIKEHPRLFSGVEVVERTVRTYPYGSLAAHVLGYIGPVTTTDLNLPGQAVLYEGDDYIGKSGAELAFENVLQGIRGARTYRVDVDGNPIALLNESPPKNGSDVCLTIDRELQEATDKIISDIISSSHLRGFPYADAGALVCIDIEDGGILASSSYPSFEPEKLANGASTEHWEELTRKGSGDPLTNRVIAGLYPAASTFKAFTSLAGLEYGIIADDTHFNCNGLWEAYGKEWGQRCWIYPSGHGTLGLEEAINQSCDIYFYNVGASFYERWEEAPEEDRPDNLQDFLKTWGFGSETGIDIAGEAGGRVPTAAWKRDWNSETPEGGQWQPGDMTNMCIGQGDILVTPLQIANGYAGIARKTMLKPHIFHRVLNDEGEAVINNTPKESEIQPAINDAHIARVEDGLQRVIRRMGGPFNELPVSVAGKSGTAEVASAKADFSWFVAFAPADEPKYCVACLVEQAGDGSSAAVLGVQHTLAKLYDVDIGDIIVTQGSRER